MFGDALGHVEVFQDSALTHGEVAKGVVRDVGATFHEVEKHFQYRTNCTSLWLLFNGSKSQSFVTSAQNLEKPSCPGSSESRELPATSFPSLSSKRMANVRGAVRLEEPG
jgi:hypothetical protein